MKEIIYLFDREVIDDLVIANKNLENLRHYRDEVVINQYFKGDLNRGYTLLSRAQLHCNELTHLYAWVHDIICEMRLINSGVPYTQSNVLIQEILYFLDKKRGVAVDFQKLCEAEMNERSRLEFVFKLFEATLLGNLYRLHMLAPTMIAKDIPFRFKERINGRKVKMRYGNPKI